MLSFEIMVILDWTSPLRLPVLMHSSVLIDNDSVYWQLMIKASVWIVYFIENSYFCFNYIQPNLNAVYQGR